MVVSALCWMMSSLRFRDELRSGMRESVGKPLSERIMSFFMRENALASSVALVESMNILR